MGQMPIKNFRNFGKQKCYLLNVKQNQDNKKKTKTNLLQLKKSRENK